MLDTLLPAPPVYGGGLRLSRAGLEEPVLDTLLPAPPVYGGGLPLTRTGVNSRCGIPSSQRCLFTAAACVWVAPA